MHIPPCVRPYLAPTAGFFFLGISIVQCFVVNDIMRMSEVDYEIASSDVIPYNCQNVTCHMSQVTWELNYDGWFVRGHWTGNKTRDCGTNECDDGWFDYWACIDWPQLDHFSMEEPTDDETSGQCNNIMVAFCLPLAISFSMVLIAPKEIHRRLTHQPIRQTIDLEDVTYEPTE